MRQPFVSDGTARRTSIDPHVIPQIDRSVCFFRRAVGSGCHDPYPVVYKIWAVARVLLALCFALALDP